MNCHFSLKNKKIRMLYAAVVIGASKVYMKIFNDPWLVLGSMINRTFQIKSLHLSLNCLIDFDYTTTSV